MVVSSHHGAREPLQNNAESSGRDVKPTGLEPDSIGIRNPEPIIFQLGVGDEMSTAPPMRIESGGTIEGGDWHSCSLLNYG